MTAVVVLCAVAVALVVGYVVTGIIALFGVAFVAFGVAIVLLGLAHA